MREQGVNVCPCGAPAKVKYCSRVCAGRFGGQQVKPQPSKECTVCGGVFTRKPREPWKVWDAREACSIPCENRRMLRGRATGKVVGKRAAAWPAQPAPPPADEPAPEPSPEAPVWRPAGFAPRPNTGGAR